MYRTLVVLVVLAGCSSMQGVPTRTNDDGSSGGDGNTQPSNCVERSSVSITASPMDLTFPTPTIVSWFASLPDDCPSLNVQLNNRAVEPVGTQTFTPGRSTEYVALVSDTSGSSSGTKSASVTVTVSRFPDTVQIDSTTQDPVNVLLGALTESPNKTQVVELCGDNLELDLGARRNIVVPSGRTLRATPGCERSLRKLGPLVFSHWKVGDPLFVINGDHVEFSGFRLEGPESGVGTVNNEAATGIRIVPPGCPDGQDCVLPGLQHVEISNMEISQWAFAGVDVFDTHAPSSELGRLWNTNVGAVHIVNNFIHHNRQEHIGYGVTVSEGAYALIERNVFNQNRHAIAGGSHDVTGRDFSGYTARDNLILPGGGLHCDWFCYHTHIIDMHGDEKHWYTGDNQCGRAGETILIERNTVLYTAGEAIRIRGNPVDKAIVDRNVFKLNRDDDWIGQAGSCSFWGFGDNITNPIDVRPTNVFGSDPMSELGSCHFAGDEVQDQFMASGVTWWVRSGLTGQWRYLNTMSEKVSELQFQDFDGDGICDVLPKLRFPEVIPKKYSKGGTTPWLPVGVIPPTQ
jgi:hypothetical protein